ncbi:MAG: hypothetical protein O0W99_06740, partial [Methanocorpusculum sp.]|nr:hypothetical protein [Methanocorpusculum sp.]MDE2534429.1 hypothetical protein [Methanocorpusculum sp.]MDE2546477.1 hypothetical protein [Methanocorpusculum sp.]
ENATSEAAPLGASALSAFPFFILPTYHSLTLRLCEISRFPFSSCPLTTYPPTASRKKRSGEIY